MADLALSCYPPSYKLINRRGLLRVEYTPTFQFYRNGAKFDEYVGSDAEQLRSQIAVAAAGQGEVNGENTTE